jgi:hypothetical protein
VTDSVGFIWGDPPEASRGRGAPKGSKNRDWITFLWPLVLRPGEWARVEVGPFGRVNGMQRNIMARAYRLPPGTWEAVSRRLDSGESGLWVRYTPEEVTP